MPRRSAPRNDMHELKEQIFHICQPFLDWCSSFGEIGLFVLALIESSVFPIPPDFLYIPMILNGASNPYALAAIATAGSALGAVIGYYIGLYGGRPVAKFFLGKLADTWIGRAEDFFGKYGSAAILIAAFTPIPFKVFTIAGGISKMNLFGFILYSIIGRGARFFTVTFLLVQFGEVIMENFFKISLIAVLASVSGYFLYKFLFERRKSR